MATDLSPRLAEIVDALPLRPGLRVLEIGCGPGAAARAVAARITTGQVLGIDRSAKAIAQAIAGSHREIASGRLRFRQVAAEEFELEEGERPYHIAFAIRVGALDGRHPDAGRVARERIRRALVRGGRLYIDGGRSSP
jgi:ubiquinone/menaquinone biosynthesis C-methylase UbiE